VPASGLIGRNCAQSTSRPRKRERRSSRWLGSLRSRWMRPGGADVLSAPIVCSCGTSPARSVPLRWTSARRARVLAEEILATDRMVLMRAKLGEELPYDTSRSRIVSSLLVVSYLVVAYGLGGGAAALKVLSSSIVPWACVCFPMACSTVAVHTACNHMGSRRVNARDLCCVVGRRSYRCFPLMQPVVRATVL